MFEASERNVNQISAQVAVALETRQAKWLPCLPDLASVASSWAEAQWEGGGKWKEKERKIHMDGHWDKWKLGQRACELNHRLIR